jgi:hypothetical protein
VSPVGHLALGAVQRDPAEERFLEIVTTDPTVAAVLDRAPELAAVPWEDVPRL